MARKRSRTAVLKRQREAKKTEKNALKREKKEVRKESEDEEGDGIATADDLAGYGFPVDDEEESEPATE